jgi:hypothetical protein
VLSTGLTGARHRSDRCSTGSKSCKFPLCVLVCFGSEGCLLVPRSSSNPVAAWAWPTWVVSRRHVLEVVFILLESPSPSRRIFIGSHSLAPPLVRRIGPSPTTQAGTGSDYYVGTQGHSTCGPWCKTAYSARQQRTSTRLGRLGMSEPM